MVDCHVLVAVVRCVPEVRPHIFGDLSWEITGENPRVIHSWENPGDFENCVGDQDPHTVANTILHDGELTKEWMNRRHRRLIRPGSSSLLSLYSLWVSSIVIKSFSGGFGGLSTVTTCCVRDGR